MQIFIGCTNIANLICEWSSYLEEMGHSIVTASAEHLHHYYGQQKFTHDLQLLNTLEQRWALMVRLLSECDLFIYIWPKQGVLHPTIDFQAIKKAGKPLVVFACGDDIRNRTLYNQAMLRIRGQDYLPVQYSETVDRSNQVTLKIVESYADLILSTDDQSILATRPFYALHIPVGRPNYTDTPPVVNPTPKICLVPSVDPKSKGTDIFLDAIKPLLGGSSQFGLNVQWKISQLELIRLLCSSDVLLDNVTMPMHGKSAVQAMLSGALAFTGCDLSIAPFPSNRPTLGCRPSNLRETLEEVVSMPYQQRFKLQQESLNYAMEFHDPSSVFNGMFEVLAGRTSKHFQKRERSTLAEFIDK